MATTTITLHGDNARNGRPRPRLMRSSTAMRRKWPKNETFETNERRPPLGSQASNEEQRKSRHVLSSKDRCILRTTVITCWVAHSCHSHAQYRLTIVNCTNTSYNYNGWLSGIDPPRMNWSSGDLPSTISDNTANWYLVALSLTKMRPLVSHTCCCGLGRKDWVCIIHGISQTPPERNWMYYGMVLPGW